MKCAFFTNRGISLQIYAGSKLLVNEKSENIARVTRKSPLHILSDSKLLSKESFVLIRILHDSWLDRKQ